MVHKISLFAGSGICAKRVIATGNEPVLNYSNQMQGYVLLKLKIKSS
jgi:hypothetical protein